MALFLAGISATLVGIAVLALIPVLMGKKGFWRKIFASTPAPPVAVALEEEDPRMRNDPPREDPFQFQLNSLSEAAALAEEIQRMRGEARDNRVISAEELSRGRDLRPQWMTSRMTIPADSALMREARQLLEQMVSPEERELIQARQTETPAPSAPPPPPEPEATRKSAYERLADEDPV